jgi:hypothetical protein
MCIGRFTSCHKRYTGIRSYIHQNRFRQLTRLTFQICKDHLVDCDSTFADKICCSIVLEQWSFGGGTPGNAVPVVIRIAQRTTITDEGTTAKSVPIVRSVPIVSHLPNDHCFRNEKKTSCHHGCKRNSELLFLAGQSKKLSPQCHELGRRLARLKSNNGVNCVSFTLYGSFKR